MDDAPYLSAGADPNQRFEDGRTPLMFAAGSGLVTAVQAVLHANTFQKTQVYASDNKGWTALHVACSTDAGQGTTKSNRPLTRFSFFAFSFRLDIFGTPE